MHAGKGSVYALGLALKGKKSGPMFEQKRESSQMLFLMSIVGKAHKDKGSVWCISRCVTANGKGNYSFVFVSHFQVCMTHQV